MAEKSAGNALAGVAAASSLATLIVALTKPAQAAAQPGEYPTVQITLDNMTKQALAAIISNQMAIDQKLGRIDQGIQKILGALGPQPQDRFLLEPFEFNNETIRRGTAFPIFSRTSGPGALLWAVVDVSDSNTSFSIRFDELVWKFKFDNLQNQGGDAPLAPGVWLSKYDPLNSHFAMIFSAGSVGGFGFSKRCMVEVTYEGDGTATLNQGRGLAWSEP